MMFTIIDMYLSESSEMNNMLILMLRTLIETLLNDIDKIAIRSVELFTIYIIVFPLE